MSVVVGEMINKVLVAVVLAVGLLALPHPAAAQVIVLTPGYPLVAPAPYPPYGFYPVPPYYSPYGYSPYAPYAFRSFGIGQYPPGYWGTDAVWRATEPHVHGYRWE
jgi:hypothetical protein